ncbi:MAG: AI-2E family transporter [Anaerolineales bacterium]|nr:AI-2E family transporter [Anaerolineales bacterium]
MTSFQETLPDNFVRRTLVVVGVVTAVVLLVILAWQILNVLVLLFAGILFGVFLTGISGWIRQHTPLSHHLALAATLLFLVGLTAVAVALAAPNLVDQSQQLSGNVQQSLDNLETVLLNQPWAQPIQNFLPDFRQVSSWPGQLLSRVSGVFSRTFGLFLNAVVILFIGLYLAFEPDKYVNGFIKLLPQASRRRAGVVLDEVAYTLRWWLVGRFASMTVIGVLSVIGLLLLGIPLAFILGVVAGLLTFIPIIGPALALIPATLVAFTVSPQKALYVFLLYMGIQVLESYFITPIIQRKAVALPPVLLIMSQVVLGLFLGLTGIAVAAPFAALLLVLTKMLYVQDVLGDDSTKLLKEDPRPHFAAATNQTTADGRKEKQHAEQT